MNDAIIVAIIAAIPATISAWAALRNKKINQKQLTPSNGHTLIQMIEDVWTEITKAALHREQLEEEDETLRGELHSHDERLAGMEQEMRKRWSDEDVRNSTLPRPPRDPRPSAHEEPD